MDTEMSAFAVYSKSQTNSIQKPPKSARRKKSHSKVKKSEIGTKLNIKKIQNVKKSSLKKGITESKKRKINQDNISEPPAKLQVSNGSIDEELELNDSAKLLRETPKSNIEVIDQNLHSEENSVEHGLKLLSWVIAPIASNKFFKKNWEKRPFHIIRHCPTYYKTLLSCEEINTLLREKVLYFTKNIDITSYVNGKRETHNPDGRAFAPVVWDYYNQGCSVRILNPQTYIKKIHTLNAGLQEYFGSMVGANIYLTPAGTQGFAPHYDDIEAFVLQIEGKKKWKLYAPRTPSEVLPRESSGNFIEEELGPVILDIELKAGDMLYFPRGTTHQACAVQDSHSLHMTLSVYQKNSWADLLEKILPVALQSAIEEEEIFRRGLPLHFYSDFGVVNSDTISQRKQQFLAELQNLFVKVAEYAPVDAAVDQMAKCFIHDALPPVLTQKEELRTVFGDGEIIKNGVIKNVAEIELDTRIKLLRYNILRLVAEDDNIHIYHSASNSKEYHGENPQYFEILAESAPAVEYLLHNYPQFVSVEDLPLENETLRLDIAIKLWQNGLVMTEEPLGYDSD